jgi:hypothetical protein
LEKEIEEFENGVRDDTIRFPFFIGSLCWVSSIIVFLHQSFVWCKSLLHATTAHHCRILCQKVLCLLWSNVSCGILLLSYFLLTPMMMYQGCSHLCFTFLADVLLID